MSHRELARILDERLENILPEVDPVSTYEAAIASLCKYSKVDVPDQFKNIIQQLHLGAAWFNREILFKLRDERKPLIIDDSNECWNSIKKIISELKNLLVQLNNQSTEWNQTRQALLGLINYYEEFIKTICDGTVKKRTEALSNYFSVYVDGLGWRLARGHTHAFLEQYIESSSERGGFSPYSGMYFSQSNDIASEMFLNAIDKQLDLGLVAPVRLLVIRGAKTSSNKSFFSQVITGALGIQGKPLSHYLDQDKPPKLSKKTQTALVLFNLLYAPGNADAEDFIVTEEVDTEPSIISISNHQILAPSILSRDKGQEKEFVTKSCCAIYLPYWDEELCEEECARWLSFTPALGGLAWLIEMTKLQKTLDLLMSQGVLGIDSLVSLGLDTHSLNPMRRRWQDLYQALAQKSHWEAGELIRAVDPYLGAYYARIKELYPTLSEQEAWLRQNAQNLLLTYNLLKIDLSNIVASEIPILTCSEWEALQSQPKLIVADAMKQWLNFIDYGLYDDRVQQQILRVIPYLFSDIEVLRFFNCTGLTDENLIYLGSLPKLKEVEITFAESKKPQITMDGLKQFLQEFPLITVKTNFFTDMNLFGEVPLHRIKRTLDKHVQISSTLDVNPDTVLPGIPLGLREKLLRIAPTVDIFTVGKDRIRAAISFVNEQNQHAISELSKELKSKKKDKGPKKPQESRYQIDRRKLIERIQAELDSFKPVSELCQALEKHSLEGENNSNGISSTSSSKSQFKSTSKLSRHKVTSSVCRQEKSEFKVVEWVLIDKSELEKIVKGINKITLLINDTILAGIRALICQRVKELREKFENEYITLTTILEPFENGFSPKLMQGLQTQLKDRISSQVPLEISQFVEEMAKFYLPLQQTLNELRAHYSQGLSLLKESRPRLLDKTVSVNFPGIAGTRLFEDPLVLQEILTTFVKHKGTATVTHFGDVHYKKDPAFPGYEIAARMYARLCFGSLTSDSLLIEVLSDKGSLELYLASETAPGVTAEEYFKENDIRTALFNLESFGSNLFNSIITLTGDGKWDNYTIWLLLNALNLTSFDNDNNFVPAYVHRDGKKDHVLYFLCWLLFVKQCMGAKIEDNTRKKLLQLPAIRLLQWLHAVTQVNNLYDYFIKQRYFKDFDLSMKMIPIHFSPGTIRGMYGRWDRMRKFLQQNPDATHEQVTEAALPGVMHVYNKALTLADGNVSNAIQILLANKRPDADTNGLTMEKCMTEEQFSAWKREVEEYGECVHEFDYECWKKTVRDRPNSAQRQTLPQAKEELLNSIDYSTLASDEQIKIVNSLPLYARDIEQLLLDGCAVLDEQQLILLSYMPHLKLLRLHNCPNVSIEGLCTLLERKSGQLVLEFCNIKISKEDWGKLLLASNCTKLSIVTQQRDVWQHTIVKPYDSEKYANYYQMEKLSNTELTECLHQIGWLKLAYEAVCQLPTFCENEKEVVTHVVTAYVRYLYEKDVKSAVYRAAFIALSDPKLKEIFLTAIKRVSMLGQAQRISSKRVIQELTNFPSKQGERSTIRAKKEQWLLSILNNPNALENCLRQPIAVIKQSEIKPSVSLSVVDASTTSVGEICMIQLLTYRIVGKISPFVAMVNSDQGCHLIQESILGINLGLQFDKVDLRSFDEVFVMTLLLNPKEQAREDFILQTLGHKNEKYKIFWLNYSSVLQPCLENSDEIAVRSFLYCCPQMYKPLHPSIREAILALDGSQVLVKWMREWFIYNGSVQKFVEASNVFFSLKQNHLMIIFYKLHILQTVLRKKPECTLMELLASVHPELANHYAQLHRISPDPLQRYSQIKCKTYSPRRFVDLEPYEMMQSSAHDALRKAYENLSTSGWIVDIPEAVKFLQKQQQLFLKLETVRSKLISGEQQVINDCSLVEKKAILAAIPFDDCRSPQGVVNQVLQKNICELIKNTSLEELRFKSLATKQVLSLLKTPRMARTLLYKHLTLDGVELKQKVLEKVIEGLSNLETLKLLNMTIQEIQIKSKSLSQLSLESVSIANLIIDGPVGNLFLQLTLCRRLIKISLLYPVNSISIELHKTPLDKLDCPLYTKVNKLVFENALVRDRFMLGQKAKILCQNAIASAVTGYESQILPLLKQAADSDPNYPVKSSDFNTLYIALSKSNVVLNVTSNLPVCAVYIKLAHLARYQCNYDIDFLEIARSSSLMSYALLNLMREKQQAAPEMKEIQLGVLKILQDGNNEHVTSIAAEAVRWGSSHVKSAALRILQRSFTPTSEMISATLNALDDDDPRTAKVATETLRGWSANPAVMAAIVETAASYKEEVRLHAIKLLCLLSSTAEQLKQLTASTSGKFSLPVFRELVSLIGIVEGVEAFLIQKYQENNSSDTLKAIILKSLSSCKNPSRELVEWVQQCLLQEKGDPFKKASNLLKDWYVENVGDTRIIIRMKVEGGCLPSQEILFSSALVEDKRQIESFLREGTVEQQEKALFSIKKLIEQASDHEIVEASDVELLASIAFKNFVIIEKQWSVGSQDTEQDVTKLFACAILAIDLMLLISKKSGHHFFNEKNELKYYVREALIKLIKIAENTEDEVALRLIITLSPKSESIYKALNDKIKTKKEIYDENFILLISALVALDHHGYTTDGRKPSERLNDYFKPQEPAKMQIYLSAVPCLKYRTSDILQQVCQYCASAGQLKTQTLETLAKLCAKPSTSLLSTVVGFLDHGDVEIRSIAMKALHDHTETTRDLVQSLNKVAQNPKEDEEIITLAIKKLLKCAQDEKWRDKVSFALFVRALNPQRLHQYETAKKAIATLFDDNNTHTGMIEKAYGVLHEDDSLLLGLTALGEMPAPERMRLRDIRNNYINHANPDIREMALRILSKDLAQLLESESETSVLHQILIRCKDEVPGVRLAAVSALSHLGEIPVDAVEVLLALAYDYENDFSIRGQALVALAKFFVSSQFNQLPVQRVVITQKRDLSKFVEQRYVLSDVDDTAIRTDPTIQYSLLNIEYLRALQAWNGIVLQILSSYSIIFNFSSGRKNGFRTDVIRRLLFWGLFVSNVVISGSPYAKKIREELFVAVKENAKEIKEELMIAGKESDEKIKEVLERDASSTSGNYFDIYIGHFERECRRAILNSLPEETSLTFDKYKQQLGKFEQIEKSQIDIGVGELRQFALNDGSVECRKIDQPGKEDLVKFALGNVKDASVTFFDDNELVIKRGNEATKDRFFTNNRIKLYPHMVSKVVNPDALSYEHTLIQAFSRIDNVTTISRENIFSSSPLVFRSSQPKSMIVIVSENIFSEKNGNIYVKQEFLVICQKAKGLILLIDKPRNLNLELQYSNVLNDFGINLLSVAWTHISNTYNACPKLEWLETFARVCGECHQTWRSEPLQFCVIGDLTMPLDELDKDYPQVPLLIIWSSYSSETLEQIIARKGFEFESLLAKDIASANNKYTEPYKAKALANNQGNKQDVHIVEKSALCLAFEAYLAKIANYPDYQLLHELMVWIRTCLVYPCEDTFSAGPLCLQEPMKLSKKTAATTSISSLFTSSSNIGARASSGTRMASTSLSSSSSSTPFASEVAISKEDLRSATIQFLNSIKDAIPSSQRMNI